MNGYTEPDLGAVSLITIDVQRDFISENSQQRDKKAHVLPYISKAVRAFRILNKPVIHIVRIYKEDGSNADLCRRASIEGGSGLLRPGSEGVQIAEELLPSSQTILDERILLSGGIQEVTPYEFIIYKPRFGAFYQTPLSSLLVKMNINTIAFSGFNFPNCPRASIYEASERDYRIVAIEDAISHIYPRGQKELENIGVVFMKAEKLVQALQEIDQEPDPT